MVRWLLWPLFVLQLVICQQLQQRIVEAPKDTLAAVGETAILTCRVEHQQGPVQWMKDDFGLGTDRDKPLPGNKRYRMVGSAANGEYNLEISNVTLFDDDDFACQISESDHAKAVVSSKAKLTVLVRPTPPKIVKSHHSLKAIAGDPITQSCLSRKGKPPPTIGWAIASDEHGKHIIAWLGESRSKFGGIHAKPEISQETVIAHVNETTQVEGGEHKSREDSNIYSIMSNLSFIPRPEDDHKYLVCISQHMTFPNKIEVDSVKLALRYAPQINLTIASKIPLRENGSALLACNINAKPLDNVKINWYKGNQKLRETGDTLTFETLKMEDHNRDIYCEATNEIGTTRGSIKLNVAFGARIMSTSQDKEVNEGDNAFFHCATLANPAPAIYWTRGDSDEIIGHGENLTLENVRTWQQGNYNCTATVDGFRKQVLSHYLHIRGPPAVSMRDEVSASLDEATEIICEISGRPKTNNVRWTLNGKEINFNNGRITVHQYPKPYGKESILKIKDLKEEDFGVYNCSANNGLGFDNRGALLKKRNLFDWIVITAKYDRMVALAILSAGILLASLLCCLCMCRNCRSKKSKFIGSDDQSDVTVKCEALDGQYFPEMYSSSPVDNVHLSTKDYISIPQNNPDLDFLAANGSFGPPGGLYPKCVNNSANEYIYNRYEHSYGSFGSGLSTPGGISDMYGVAMGDKLPVMETLQEVETPKTSNYNFLSSPDVVRPISRTSTHV
ncbi:hypothetical protein L3Y34_010907 [Caenorhabditis briggsae]|uniref:Ig-like domain-containing protein n=1 Tax=Caenorhabditis briggsae TaxID=6238 RepID=A0AAE8ZKP4_CAEBR|nr:hypothetical protein L3Y34_010907 [Caenorhabditis briggsae]